MFPLNEGGYIVETRESEVSGSSIWKRKKFLIFSPKYSGISEHCRFYNCTHIHEPGCAVIEAVQNGRISESRYWSYLSMMEESKEKYR